MGEYAVRISDGERIKIGTCEEMYYLRYEDRDKVTPEENSGFGLRWRLPFPDEDSVEPGDYKEYNREVFLPDFEPSPEFDSPGTFQVSHKSGLLINVTCHHGTTLPESSASARFFWNGRGVLWALVSIRSTKEGIFPVIRCTACGEPYRESWERVLPHISDKILRARLEKYSEEDSDELPFVSR